MTTCDHKFVDSPHCLKCGWVPQETSSPKPIKPADQAAYLDEVEKRIDAGEALARWELRDLLAAARKLNEDKP